MNPAERTRSRPPQEQHPADPLEAGPDGASLEALAQEGAAFAAAAGDLIESALSGNSEEFLSANEQQSGE